MKATPPDIQRAQTAYAKLRQRQLAYSLSGQLTRAINYTHRINRLQTWALGSLGIYTFS